MSQKYYQLNLSIQSILKENTWELRQDKIILALNLQENDAKHGLGLHTLFWQGEKAWEAAFNEGNFKLILNVMTCSRGHGK